MVMPGRWRVGHRRRRVRLAGNAPPEFGGKCGSNMAIRRSDNLQICDHTNLGRRQSADSILYWNCSDPGEACEELVQETAPTQRPMAIDDLTVAVVSRLVGSRAGFGDQTARRRSEPVREFRNVAYLRRPISGLVYSQIWRFVDFQLLGSADFGILKSAESRICKSGD